MFTLFEPSDAQIEKFLAEQKDLPFSYTEVGASQNRIPSGYSVNHHRKRLGAGADTFSRAKKAIQNWTMYRLDWTQLYPPPPDCRRRSRLRGRQSRFLLVSESVSNRLFARRKRSGRTIRFRVRNSARTLRRRRRTIHRRMAARRRFNLV